MSPVRRLLAIALFSSGIVLGVSAAQATVIASSTFDSNGDFWRAGNLDSPHGAVSIPTWHSTGGNPGGYITTTDLYVIVGFIAPAKFLGNQSAAYGGTLTFDLFDNANGRQISNALLVLEGAGKSISIASALPAKTSFTPYLVTLTETAFDYYVSGATGVQGNTPVTQADFLDVLSNLTFLGIEADWHENADLAGLDNVFLNSAPQARTGVPEPLTLPLFSAGLAGAVALRRRRNRTAN